MEKKKVLKEGSFASLIVFALALLAVLSLILPYANYVYNKTTFSISGFDFFSGTTVMNGSVAIASQSSFIFGFVGVGIAVLAAVLYFKVSKRLFGLLTILGGGLNLVSPIVFMYNANALLKEVKKPSTAFGVYITLAIGLLLVIYGASVLYRNKDLHMLDFMVLPGVVYLIINNYIPMSGVIIAFKDLDFSVGIFSSPWAGFENFKFLFQSNDAWYIIRNTLAYNVAFIILGNLTGIIIGICLAECYNKIVQRTAQTLILLPQLISWVIISYIVYGFLATDAGWINKTLLSGRPNISFYGERKYWPFILVIVYLWQGLGYRSIIFLSSIVGIDRNLYEAAYIDGAGKMKQITKITLPMLKGTIITLVIMAVGRIMNSDFGLFYQTTQNSGALYRVTQTLDVYIYRAIMETQNLGMGSAAAAFQSVCGFCLIMVTNAIVKKVDESNALF